MISEHVMQRVQIDGTTFEAFDQGTGDPVMFIHGAGSIECHAVLNEPALLRQHRVVHIHRRGYGDSEPRDGDTTMALEAADCRAALNAFGIERAHFVGESSGGVIVLQYALDYPETVRSIALLEPALPEVVNASDELNAALELAGERFGVGDPAGAADAFFREVCGPDYRTVLDPNLPAGWMDTLARDMDTIVFKESPAMDAWSFTRDDAARLTMPVLNVLGAESRPYFRECFELIGEWIPHAENLVLPDTRHCILEMNPGGISDALIDFFEQHPSDR